MIPPKPPSIGKLAFSITLAKHANLSLLADGCISMAQLKQIHCQMITTARIHDTYAASRLLNFCALADSGDLNYALKLFKSTPEPNSFMWNTIIRARASSQNPQEAMLLYNDMRRFGVTPGKHTFPFVLKACSNLLSLQTQQQPEMKLAVIFIICIFWLIASADILQNPDFELPITNLPTNSTSPFVLLNENSTIPGWTFQGEVRYVTAGVNASLPRNGHAIMLGQDGKINQTFTANGDVMQYLLTFTLAQAGQNCKANVSLVVSAPDSSMEFSLTQKYSKETREVYGHRLGSWGDGEYINLILQSQATDVDPNSACWPVVDTLLLKTIGPPAQNSDNLLPNGGFESGPAFLDSSGEGILLVSEPSLVESALQQWTTMGNVKYINSKNYFVPEGKAAIEIVSEVSGIQTAKPLSEGSNYNLEFMLGDANDSCSGEFIVGVVAGASAQNISLLSSGTGAAKKYSMTFKGEPSPTPITFLSYKTTQRKDGVFCGPVIDGVVLSASHGHKSDLQLIFLFALLHVALLQMS
ncbi:unnamed protein product [Fraxinus pennsylvanica]|uniref:DUF642 domain-containing protein n=1 Tax=Fraxinus pennsylvanica TaxID=56036 RepID=A0AAD1YJL6_9LAMI|nr:unnamed protein product [Fraxinus pennsylvanica]